MTSRFLRSATAIFCLAFCGEGFPQAYPSKPISMVVPLGPGSQADNVARVLAERLQAALGQPVLVENRPGAEGTIGTEFVAKAAPDGHTLLFALSSPMTIAPTLYAERSRYDSEKDFAPITQIARVTLILATSAQFPFNDLKQFVAYTRSHPRTAAIGYLAGINYLMALRVRQAGADVELIRYKGVTAIWTDLLGGRIHAGVEPLSSDLPQIQAGKLKALAIFGSSRSALIPDIATVREQGYPEIEGEAWNALLTRAGTPPAVIDRLNREVVRILALPEVQERLRGVEIKTSDPQSVARMIREDTIRWAKVIRDFDVKPDN
jgi:tripartite-type tricarboxylate transporter receptor subunit TctC